MGVVLAGQLPPFGVLRLAALGNGLAVLGRSDGVKTAVGVIRVAIADRRGVVQWLLCELQAHQVPRPGGQRRLHAGQDRLQVQEHQLESR